MNTDAKIPNKTEKPIEQCFKKMIFNDEAVLS